MSTTHVIIFSIAFVIGMAALANGLSEVKIVLILKKDDEEEG